MGFLPKICILQWNLAVLFKTLNWWGISNGPSDSMARGPDRTAWNQGADFSVEGAGKKHPALSGGIKLWSSNHKGSPSDASGSFRSGSRAPTEALPRFFQKSGQRYLVTFQSFEKPLNPPSSPFFKGGKSGVVYRMDSIEPSSLWQREAGRDFWECLFKKLNWY